MSEHESNLQRQPTGADAGPADPTRQTPGVEHSQPEPAPATPVGLLPGPVPPVPSGAHPAVPAPGAAPNPGAAPAPPAAGPNGPYGVGHTSTWPSAGPPATATGEPTTGIPGQPTVGSVPGQPTVGSVPGQPAMGPVPGQPPYVGGGAFPPGWSPTPAGPAPQPGRLGKYVAAGFAALVLMVGSAFAGGVVALALDDSPSGGKTYVASPAISRDDLPAIAESVRNSVVSISTGNSEGSGVVLTADGYILTNNHVVEGARNDRVRVAFADGKTAEAEIVGTDPRTDLAVIKAAGVSNLTPATFGDSDAMRVGDTVLALGSPLGLEGSVTAGIISAENRTIRTGGIPRNGRGATSISGLLQTDAPINPGNSGGALVNTRGEVIGINTAIATSGQGSGNIGLGFAIPSNKAKAVADALMKGEKVSHPVLGVDVSDAPDGGALIGAVSPGSPAERAGLRQGDIVIRFGDKAISDSDDLVAAVQAGKVGEQVEIIYIRNGTENRATVALAEAS